MDRKEHDSNQMLQKAIDSLDEAVRACLSGDEKALDDHVWKAAFYLEHLTFILSLSRKDANDAWKKGEKTGGVVDLKATLLLVRDLLKEALRVGSGEEVYRKAWIARGYLFSVQQKLVKTKSK